MTLEDALEGYWLEKRRNFSPTTIREYSLTFRRFCEYLGSDFRFERITATHVRIFLEEMKELRLSPKSISNCWTALSSLWTWAEREMSAPHILRGKVAKPRVRRSVIEPYTRADVGLMLNACSNNAAWTTRTSQRTVANERPEKLRDRAVLLVLLDTGIRAQELCNLRMQDFDNKAGKLNIRHGKGDKHRSVYLGEAARKTLWRYFVSHGALKPDDVIQASTCSLRNCTYCFHRRPELPRHIVAANFGL